MTLIGHSSAGLDTSLSEEWGITPTRIRRRCKEAEATRDRMIRVFNRLEAAVSHHKKAHDSGRYFADDPDEALWKARAKILSDYAEGKG